MPESNRKLIQVTVSSPDVKTRIRAIAQREGLSESQVVAQIIDAGIYVRERDSVRNFGRD